MQPSSLYGRKVVLGVTGGIAAYKAIDLLRLLTQTGADVEVVLTPAATKFVTPLTFSALAGKQVHLDLFDDPDPIPHTRLGQQADLVVIAPATANFVGHVAGGLAQDLLTNIVLATRAPIVCALAMHTEMWEKPAVQRNIETLRADGVFCIDPESGPLAGGDVGVGRMAEPEEIFSSCESLLSRDLSGTRILITAGGTREPIDPVRFLGNRSSGKMGYAISQEAVRRGAEVVLITSATLPIPFGVDAREVETASEMHSAVMAEFDKVDAVVMAAAVADFRARSVSVEKIKKRSDVSAIELEPTADILSELGERKGSKYLVGFAAETNDVPKAGLDKVVQKHLDLLVANLVGVPDSGFGTETNRAWFCAPDDKIEDLGVLSKTKLAALICDRIAAAVS